MKLVKFNLNGKHYPIQKTFMDRDSLQCGCCKPERVKAALAKK